VALVGLVPQVRQALHPALAQEVLVARLLLQDPLFIMEEVVVPEHTVQPVVVVALEAVVQVVPPEQELRAELI
jgi:hypothetical protein